MIFFTFFIPEEKFQVALINSSPCEAWNVIILGRALTRHAIIEGYLCKLLAYTLLRLAHWGEVRNVCLTLLVHKTGNVELFPQLMSCKAHLISHFDAFFTPLTTADDRTERRIGEGDAELETLVGPVLQSLQFAQASSCRRVWFTAMVLVQRSTQRRLIALLLSSALIRHCLVFIAFKEQRWSKFFIMSIVLPWGEGQAENQHETSLDTSDLRDQGQ